MYSSYDYYHDKNHTYYKNDKESVKKIEQDLIKLKDNVKKTMDFLNSLPDDIEVLIFKNKQLLSTIRMTKPLIQITYSTQKTETFSFNFQFLDNCLPDLSRFYKLNKLECTNCNLKLLNDHLPDTIQYLNCYNNNLIELENLPESLLSLNCSQNFLERLPELPIKLRDLYCCNNYISLLPTLPSSLEYLDVCYNKISYLPNLPNTLIRFWCSSNKLKEIPGPLSDSLEILHCNQNELIKLPILSKELITLNCSYNKINIIPNMPEKLAHVECDNNNLIDFPDNFDNLKFLFCYNNPFTYKYMMLGGHKYNYNHAYTNQLNIIKEEKEKESKQRIIERTNIIKEQIYEKYQMKIMHPSYLFA